MLIPVIIGAVMLGRAFDMSNVRTTSYYIFDEEDIQKNFQTIERPFTRSEYRLVESSSEANNFLNVAGDLSLKVKNDMVGLKGYGDYLQSSLNRANSIELLLTVYHETVTETFPSYTKQKTEWRKRPQRDIGTHYIRSITYGGHLMISYILTANNEEYREEIKAAVSANLQLSGSLDVNATGDFEKLKKSIEGKATLNIKTYATAGIFSPPSTLEEIFKLVDDYPNLVKGINNGKGAPLKLELEPLSTLNPDYVAFVKSQAIEGIVDEATNKYDDIRSAIADFKNWEDEGHIWDDDDQDLIDDFQTQLKLANKAMVKAISDLDISENASPNQFDEAYKVYASGGMNIPNRYTRWLSWLKHKLPKIPYYWFPYTKAVTHYIHWGGTNCSLPSPEPVFYGYAASSPSGFGNGGSIECLPGKDPALDLKNVNSNTKVSRLNGMSYELLAGSGGQVLCAYCRLENATSAYTIAGRTECPEQMKLEYRGYLNINSDSGTASAYVCLEETPADSLPDEMLKKEKMSGTLNRVWTECPDCEDTNKKYVTCVVCSR